MLVSIKEQKVALQAEVKEGKQKCWEILQPLYRCNQVLFQFARRSILLKREYAVREAHLDPRMIEETKEREVLKKLLWERQN